MNVQRAACPACGRELPLTIAGRIRKHYGPDGRHPCAGAGQQPVAAT